jgi:hypothetical protein
LAPGRGAIADHQSIGLPGRVKSEGGLSFDRSDLRNSVSNRGRK